MVESALKESLRLYPPVLSLVRYVGAEDGVVVPPIPTSCPAHAAAAGAAAGAAGEAAAAGGGTRAGGAGVPAVVVAKGETLTVCVGAAARAGWARPDLWEPRRFWKPPRTSHSSGEEEDESSSESDENEDGQQDDARGDVLAFGLGPRACPAGSLSLLLAKQLTCAVVSTQGIRCCASDSEGCSERSCLVVAAECGGAWPAA